VLSQGGSVAPLALAECMTRVHAGCRQPLAGLFSMQISLRHPGSIAMVGDFNNHYFYPPPPSSISTLHNLPGTLNVRAKRTLDTSLSRASTAAHLKTALQKLCDQLQAIKAALLEGHSSLPLLLTSVRCLACACVMLLRSKYILIYKFDATG